MNYTEKESTFIDNYERLLGAGTPEGTQYVFRCPFPGCEDTYKKKFFVDPDKGFWNCKRCRYQVPGKEYRANAKEPHGGTHKEFATLMGDDLSLWPKSSIRSIPKSYPLTQEEVSSIWSYMFSILELAGKDRKQIVDRGINPGELGAKTSTGFDLLKELSLTYDESIILRAGIAYKNDEGKIIPYSCIKKDRILIPYYSYTEDTKEIIKTDKGYPLVRYFAGYQKCPGRGKDATDEEWEDFKGSWKKLVVPAIYAPQLYGHIPKGSDYGIVTEGQLKTAAASQRGFNIVGKVGMSASREVVAKYFKTRKIKAAIILYDSESSSKNKDPQELIDYEAARQAVEFLKAGVKVYRANLPIPEGSEKEDIDSYLLSHTTKEFLEEIVLPSVKRPYKVEEKEEGEN